MSIENELKYVLRGWSGLVAEIFRMPGAACAVLDQAYLSPETRIRRTAPVEGEPSHVLGFKRRLPDGTSIDVSGAISGDQFDLLWSVASERLRKTRMSFSDGEVSWDVDFFDGPTGAVTIVVAEAEMPPEMERPPRLPRCVAGRVALAVPRGDGRFSARKLSDPAAARNLAALLGASS